ncbi:MAG: hypothetical protein IH901_00895 [Proteobacteria bacterium]|nr:hypothetical protein [Pseudomonadota bacterium]
MKYHNISVAITVFVFGCMTIGSTLAQECQPYSSNRDYCGPEDNPRVAAVIPDFLFGDFRGSCESHDFCYYSSALEIVQQMEQYQSMSLQSVSPSLRSTFASQIDSAKRNCDNNFLRQLLDSCGRNGYMGNVCDDAAMIYVVAVKKSKSGDRAFEDAMDKAAICR